MDGPPAANTREPVLYRERVPAGALVRGLFLGFVLPLTVAMAVLLAATGDMAILAAIGVLAALLFLGWNYRAITIVVTGESFEARYGLFNRMRVPIESVAACHPDSASFGRYLGIGVRVGLDGSYAYTTHFGPAVRIERAGRRPLVISTWDAPGVCAAIKQARQGRG